MNKARNILIIRLSAIGDVVFASPLILALKQYYPGVRLSWLVEPGAAPLLQHNPDLDEVILWPKAEWKRLWRERRIVALWREVRQFSRALKRRRFDLVLDLQGLMKSGVLAWLSAAPERIGLGSHEGSQWLMTRVVERGGDVQRIGSEYLHLGERLGLATDVFEMRVVVDDSAENFVRELVTAKDLSGGYLVVCPFTTRPQKHWFNDRWAKLIPRLQQEFGVAVVMLGGPDDSVMSKQITSLVNPAVINLTGQTGLTQAAALISHARLLVGVDTGLTHMGIAFSRPTVALFGSTCPYLNTMRENAVVIYHKFTCSPCRRNPTCQGAFDCMAAISVTEVLDTARRVMATGEMKR